MEAGKKTGRVKAGAQNRPAVVVMGVAGCGKSAVGTRLAKGLGALFIEGDALQPPENVALMARGEPLNDELRAGWLDAVGQSIRAAMIGDEGAVAACSALKRIYRDRLRRSEPSIAFIHLVISREESYRRVANRRNHYMPASLVDSQFETLEPLGIDEPGLSISATRPIGEIVHLAKAFLARRAAQSPE